MTAAVAALAATLRGFPSVASVFDVSPSAIVVSIGPSAPIIPRCQVESPGKRMSGSDCMGYRRPPRAPGSAGRIESRAKLALSFGIIRRRRRSRRGVVVLARGVERVLFTPEDEGGSLER